jgi:hypothetical protein
LWCLSTQLPPYNQTIQCYQIAHYIPCFQNVQSEKLGHVFNIVLHMFLCGLNLNKTMGFSIYGHKEVGILRNLKSLNVVNLALCSGPSLKQDK